MGLSLKDIKPPVKIEWIDHADNRGSWTKRATVIRKAGRNLETSDGDWLWWTTITRYGPVVEIATKEEVTKQ